MNIGEDMGLWAAWLIVTGLLCHVALHILQKLSPEFRVRRKRRRNYGRVIARGRRPMVLLSVNARGK
jgi:hypothetical protein